MSEEEKTQHEPKAAAAPQDVPKPDTPTEHADTKKAEAEHKPAFLATDPPKDKHYWWGTGRRKTAVARVRIRPGTGKFIVNDREFAQYFVEDKDRLNAVVPLEVTNMVNAWDVWVNVAGGGLTGQAGAVVLGLARAIARAVPDAEIMLRKRGLLTRDARMRERKKYGQPGARKKFQYSKR